MIYQPVSLVHVSLNFGSTSYKVGRLALVKRKIYFEYDSAFLRSGLDISPLKLPKQDGAILCADAVFEGLFGVFNDSLPDGWGRLLLDRHVRKHGMLEETVGVAKPLANTIIDEVQDAAWQWSIYAEEAGVTKTSKKIIADVINS